MPLYFGAVFAADPHDSGSFIISEANFYRPRDTVMLQGGCGQLAFGTVLGRITATGLYVPAPAAATDGSDTAIAILFEDTDASGPDNVPAGVVARDADVYAGALSYDVSVAAAADIAAKWAQLEQVGIIVRQRDDPAARAENNLRRTLGY